MTAQIKVKVQRKAIVKFKGIVKFPANVAANPGIIITHSGQTYTFSLDPTALPGVVGLVIGTNVQAQDADLQALADNATNGLWAHTGAGTGAARTLTGTANRLAVTNGDGVAGNPTFDISATYVGQATITTLGTIGTGVWQATKIGLAFGGTNADLSATGGTSQVLKQSTVGGAVTVGQLATTDLTGLGAGVATFLATPTSANLRGALTDETGTGAAVFATSPALVTPTGIVKGDVGLGNVDNTSDVTKNAAAVTFTNKTMSGAANTFTNINGTSVRMGSDAQGDILYFDGSNYVRLPAGTTGNFLKTLGAGANPAWGAVPGGGDMLAANNLSDVADATGDTARKNIKVAGKNYLLNPSGTINQLGVGSQTDGTYDFDQWLTLTQTAAVTVSQLTLVEDTTPFMMRTLQAQASAQRFGRIQWLTAAACRDLRSQSVTLSARVRCSASTTLRYAIVEWNGTADTITKDIVNDWTSATFTTGNFFTSTGTNLSGAGSIALTANTLTDITALTASVSNGMNNLSVFFWTDSTQAQNVTLDIGKVKLEKSSKATPFVHDSFDAQLIACEFHVKKSYSYGTIPGTNLGAAPSCSIYFNSGGSIAGVSIQFARHMFKSLSVGGGITLYDSIGGSGVVSTFGGVSWANGQTFNAIVGADTGFGGFASAQGINFEYVAIARL